MGVSGGLRAWVPLPTKESRFAIIEWLLLEGNRTAVTGSLLTMTFASILAIGSLWTFEMQQLLTETEAVQTLLNTVLGGIILLVSIVVSINSIVLSYQIASLSVQQQRIEDALSFRRELGTMTTDDRSPTDPNSFLSMMTTIIRKRARAVAETPSDADVDADANDEISEQLSTYIADVIQTTESLERSLERAGGGEFSVLWVGLETDYSGAIDRSHALKTAHRDAITEHTDGSLEELIRAFELFATGREYFKTLYYSREVSMLSRRLLIVSLPSILVTASTILAINARLLPDMWLLGLPPLLTFVSATFTIALAPFIVLTAHMLRLTTVSLRTLAAGPFSLRS